MTEWKVYLPTNINVFSVYILKITRFNVVLFSRCLYFIKKRAKTSTPGLQLVTCWHSIFAEYPVKLIRQTEI